jgi:putative endopeptidase
MLTFHFARRRFAKTMIKQFLLTLLCSLGIVALRAQTEPEKSPAKPEASRPPTVHDASHTPATNPPPVSTSAKTAEGAKLNIEKNAPPFDTKNIDKSVKPGEDFFRFANGGWLKRTPIPPEYARWGTFNELIERNNDALRAIAEKAAKGSAQSGTEASSSEMQMVGDFYASGMDEKTINAEGAKPLQEELDRINGMKDQNDLVKEIGRLHSMGVGALFGFTSGQDDKNSTMMIAQAFQGGLGMPDRDYYLKDDDASKKLREKYIAHVTKMFSLLGDSKEAAAKNAKTVMDIETSLAKPARSRVDLRDPQKNYNKMVEADLQKLTPDFNWADYFAATNLSEPGDINVGQPDFFKGANEVFKTVSLDDWKTYLRWHLVLGEAPALSKDFELENFNFFQKALTGVKEQKPRWKRVVTVTDGEIGQALGKLYVAEHFPPEAKTRAAEMINNLKEALADDIKSLEWMDEPTKQAALKKLAAITVKVGYPDKWRDYSSLKIDRGSYVANVMRADAFEVDRLLKKIGKPVDRTEWGMTPPTVNAYYNPTMNEIVFPAGILQPPMFDANADDAINYGGIGTVIGHEMTHGFDDQGRQYDAEGNLKDWWSAASAEAYKKRSQLVVDQYAAYEPLPGKHLNGELTQGENIADIGGVKIAFLALQKALAKNPEAAQKKIDGFTPEQRFFLGYAQAWRANQRDEDTMRRLVVDPHSPGRFRCNGPLSNMPEFAKAFEVAEGAPMVRPPDKRVNIW